ncbi:MAG: class I SAM-dependent methyltransferase [Nitriliruptorales bacterium]
MDASDWDLRYREHELVWSVEPNRFLVEEVGDLAPGRALDLACGEGRNAIWLAERGWEVTAVDFSQVAIDKARRLAAARSADVDWVRADVTAWAPDDPAAFDLVAVLYLHLPPTQRRDLFARLAGWVVGGGTVLVVGHDRENIEHGYGGPPYPEILLTPDMAAELDGLDILKAGRVDRPVETEDGTAVAIDTLLRATHL